jgi:carbohydrate diacid regulator
MLHASDYQNIVDRVIGILGKNVNIMDTSGLIIASGDESRVGAFHEIAAQAAAENKEIIVDLEHASELMNVKPGVNVPINFDSEVIGVVGITGNPEEVAGYGKIIKELVELMVHDKQQKKLELFQYRAVRSLIMELIKKSDPDPDELQMLENRATLSKFDLKKKRVLIVVDIENFGDFISKNSLSEVQIQGLKQSVIDLISVGADPTEAVFNLGEDRFMILKSDEVDMESFCNNKHDRIYNRLGINLIFAEGGLCADIRDYHQAYVKAMSFLDIANKLRNIYHISERHFDIYLLIHEIPDKIKNDYLERLGNFLSDSDDKIIETVKVFFESGMNSKETAAKLFIHKNTLIYRLNKVRDQYRIDPFNPFQCMKLYLAVIMRELSYASD